MVASPEQDPAALRRAIESARAGASVDVDASPTTASLLAALRRGPDPAGALLRAGNLGDDALLALVRHPAAVALLHQGSYPARLLNLTPAGLDVPSQQVSDGSNPGVGALRDELRALAERSCAAEAIGELRTREYLRIARLEIDDAPLELVGGALSDLAAACTDFALAQVAPHLHDQVVVFGMGKLGGNELNFLSDIDLLFCHDDALIPAGADGFRPRAKLFDALRQVVRLLEGEGVWRPVFRVDLRLRPFGTRGPLSLSRAALLDYYERHGRPWERQMWLRARPIAGARELGRTVLRGLEPFVWRRALSPAVFQEIEAMMRRARRDADRGLDEAWCDLKYGAGGIREVEFFVQGLQLLNGGRNPNLRAPGTLEALDRLLAAGLVSDREHRELTEAYRWLRRVEHRVQLVEGRQTHAVAADPEARAQLALRLIRPAEAPRNIEAARSEFEATADGVFERVQAVTAQLMGPDEGEASNASTRGPVEIVRDPTAPPAALEQAFAKLGLFDPAEAAGVLASLRADANSAFRAAGEAAVGADRLLRACLDAPDPDAALRRLAEFSSRRPAHYAAWRFLAAPEHEATVRLVAELFSSSEQLSRGLVGFPGPAGRAGDEALSPLVEIATGDPLVPAQIQASVDAVVALGLEEGELDRALLMNQYRQLTRIALQDIARRPAPATIGVAVSTLAEATLGAVLRDHARQFERAHPEGPAFSLCVVGLGKLGMRSMDYGSDLDLVFVFEPAGGAAVQAQDAAVRVTRSLRRRLENRAHGGRLFEVDMRLRPSGRQGLLVSSLESFARYHDGNLPTWERLASLRMRPVVEVGFGPGAAPLAETGVVSRRIEREIRPRSVWSVARDDAEIAADVRALKSRIEEELSRETRKPEAVAPDAARYNAKTGAGGALELELLVAALQLRAGLDADPDHAVRSRDIWRAMDGLTERGVLTPEEHRSLDAAYVFLRRLLNRLRTTAVGGREDPELFAGNSPRLAPLARRMGLEGVDALLARFLEHRSVVRAAFDRHLALPNGPPCN